MKITKISPNRIIFEDYSESQLAILQANCKYHDLRVDQEILRFKRGLSWFITQHGEEEFYIKLNELKLARYKTVLFKDEDGTLWTYAGLGEKLSTLLDSPVEDQVIYPESELIPWLKPPEFTLYPYQDETVNLLLEKKHAGVSLSTGLGKTLIILTICKKLGLKTVIMAPSKNIAKQIYALFLTHFGKKYVGFYGDGKKDPSKLFVIGIAASLTRVDPESEDFEKLSSSQVFISDESHLTPANTFEKVCSELCANAPYRFFFSGTQMRTDGLDVLLDGITGPLVKKMSVKDGVVGGYLSPPIFKMVQLGSASTYKSEDINKMTRRHLFYNPQVVSKAATIINYHISQGKPVLVLIEELEQFAHLLPHLKHAPKFAHGPVTQETRSKIAPEFHKCDVEELVDEFNRGDNLLLIGTSCISIGTDLKATQVIVFLQGGISEINVRQSIGRGTRLYPGKKDCLVYDFDVVSVPSMHRHAMARRVIYEDIYGPVKTINSNVEVLN